MHPLFQPLIDEVARTKGVTASAVALLNGIPARVQAAVDAALAGGATAQQVADAVASVMTELTGATNDLAAAVDAND